MTWPAPAFQRRDREVAGAAAGVEDVVSLVHRRADGRLAPALVEPERS